MIWGGELKRASTNRTSLFAQDNWQITLGTDAQRRSPARSEPGGDSVHGTLLSNDPIAPRVGLAWDVTSSHRTVVRAHYGRYYEENMATWVLQSDQSVATPETTAAMVGPGPDDFEMIEVDDPAPSAAWSIPP